ncbi:MAG: hypothetical protein A2W90_00965 [Bacteroidetes bacterium GWF2_42_66]|nr:MAG: hypothetical protein A2W92_24335 [Bacteroidetes bacterium GWA2_42_15]OFX99426.1 MAG: hypothetical protein A2W89_12370 [Bacteroidetes bacterium GWE2_42_39]OFY40477.1 MAG: hypothetical protein A2W90_00965 [Bacteroidetes bacterium GWF2_42_66]HBL76899.1 hypothetical protein [Prolixibacteraceae bacterium]HCR92308.1 hypothetical protein [Prolixibacteraceae bacterium]
MWKSVIYKEWLKVRWFLIGFTALGIFGVGYIFLKVQHDFAFMEAKNYWYNSLFKGLQYFGYLKFLPLAGALAIGVAQYFPETINKRIKLTFHLPLKENKVLMMMHTFGTCSLLAAYLLIFAVFFGFSKIFFASEMVNGAVISVFPWFLAGLTSYFIIALVVLEPIWKYRIFYSLIGGFFVTIYLKSAVTAGYGPANPILFVLTACLSIALIFSAYRFRKGEM